MQVRIISGQFGGRRINAPDNNRTHPMSERIRGAIFNSLGDLVKDAQVLDAFAGSGAIGLEALSRGAKNVTFIERDRLAQKNIAQNIELLGLDSQANLIKTSVTAWSERNLTKKFDLIFADPPYFDVQFSTIKRLFRHLKPGALMILSYPGRGESLEGSDGIVVVDNRRYSEAAIRFFRREH